MSWVGVKKAVDRATTQIMVKTGQIDQTIDSQFDYEEKRYRLLEKNTIQLQKLLKTYYDSIKVYKSTELNMAETLKSFYGDKTENKKEKATEVNNNGTEEEKEEGFESLAQGYHQTLKDLNSYSISELENPYNQTILNPISRFNSYFSDINEAIKKRNNKLLDYDKLKNKVRKLMEFPSQSTETNITESNKQMHEAEDTYNNLNNELKTDLPKFMNLRIPFLNPTFESFVKLQSKFFQENYQQLNQLQNKVDAESKMLFEQGRLDDKLDNVLSKMEALDILGM